jgi:hypothetical protein
MVLNSVVTVEELLDTMNEDESSIKHLIKVYGGYNTVSSVLLNYLLNNDLGEEYLRIIGYVIFDNSPNSSYYKDWEYWELELKKLSLNKVVFLLSEFCPKYKNSSDYGNTILDWLLNNKYSTKLTIEIYNELKDLFEKYEIDSDSMDIFRHHEHFKNELKLFNDVDFIRNNYTNFGFDKNEILEILKGLVIKRKIDNPAKLNLFLALIEWYAPKKMPFGPNYRKEFILEIILANDESGIESWSEDSFERIREEFYDIDFNYESYEMIKSLNDGMIQDEVNHIKKMTELNPSYRHD